jgi:hypothetical protein
MNKGLEDKEDDVKNFFASIKNAPPEDGNFNAINR